MAPKTKVVWTVIGVGALGVAAAYLLRSDQTTNASNSLPSANGAGGASRLDALLASPPSTVELAEIATGPEIVLDPGVPEAARGVLMSMLRASLAIEFDPPIPVLGTRRVWDYLKRHIRRIRLSSGIRGHDRTVAMTADARTGEVQIETSGWFVNGSLTDEVRRHGWAGMITLAHEARHIAPGDPGHRCNSDCSACVTDLYARSMGVPGGAANDESITLGGAYAATYYIQSWLADRSGSWLSAHEREQFRAYAASVLSGSMCDGKSPQRLRMPNEA